MIISKSFFKTEKNAPSDAVFISHKLLYRGGFIRQVATSRYALLPLGMRVQKKIIKAIEEELEAIGAMRMELPLAHPIEILAVTNRNKAWRGHIIKANDRTGQKILLNATGASLMTELFRSIKPSYKDLPINVYLFLPKFRDELRPQGGLINASEFLMKDAYNFEATEESFMKTYKDYWCAYDRIFRRVGIETVPVIAKSGVREVDFSHKFVLITPDVIEKLNIFWDEDEKIEEMEIVDVSRNYKRYKKIIKIYNQHPEKTIKNMMYKVNEKDNICVTIRGDYKIDFTKLRRFLKYKQIRPLTAGEIKELGSHIESVSSIGLNRKVKVIVDETVKYNKNYWDGGHRNRVFRKNVNFERDFEYKDTFDIHENKIYNIGGENIVTCDCCGYKADIKEAEFVCEEVNKDEEMKEFKMINQPEWVRTMEDNLEYYKKLKSHFIKNVVYRDKKERLIIAVVRGDLEASPLKISKLLGCGELELADDGDLASIGTKSGWVHSWGHDEGRDNVIYVCDEALKVSRNLIGGYKEQIRDAFNVNYGRDFKCNYEGDIASAYDVAKCKHCKDGYLRVRKGIEMGHIFKYDQYYSKYQKAYFVDKDGKEKPMWMGEYRIGIGRVIAGVVEISHDKRGIIWPKNIAPYLISLVTIGKSKEVMAESEKIYKILQGQGLEVLWDDRRDASPGVKLIDADLIGSPIRIVLSERSLEKGCVEMKLRSEENIEYVKFDKQNIISAVKNLEKVLDERAQELLKNPSYISIKFDKLFGVFYNEKILTKKFS